ncbi:hypothetical protein HMPREF3038_01313 [Akkermansia sp. KLE1797]|nr:hypothetical protein HMPREF3038_01313 [Akkermansia sp. KLE1797]
MARYTPFVAPSRVRGLKHGKRCIAPSTELSHPHGCVDEARMTFSLSSLVFVAPSRVRLIESIMNACCDVFL